MDKNSSITRILEDFHLIFIAFKSNVDFLLSNVSENRILFLNDDTFSNETWHVVRTCVSLQSCPWETSKTENCGYGRHRNLRYEKNNQNCLYLFGNFRYPIPQTQIFALFDEE